MFVFHMTNSKHRRQSIHKSMGSNNHSLASKYSSSHTRNSSSATNSGSTHRNSSTMNYTSFHHTVSASSQQPSAAPIRTYLPESSLSMRGRRGRQARPSQLSPSMHKAVRRFSRSVGAPNVVPPAGFRDFRGWLIRLSSRECRPIWDQLIASIARDVSCDIEAIHALKEDVVREIVKCVVVPRPDESAKLVSTNAGRQASRPRSGTTLMVVLDQQLARVESKLPRLVADMYPSRTSSSEGRHNDNPSMSSPHLLSNSLIAHAQTVTTIPWTHRQRSSVPSSYQRQASGRLPSVHDLLSDDRSTPRALPSFKELDASLRRSRSSQHGTR